MYFKRTLAALAATSLATRIIGGLALGIFTGLFFGEPAAALQPVADIYNTGIFFSRLDQHSLTR